MTEEEWRPIPGWEGRYEISSLARVRSVTPTGRRRAPRKPAFRRDGYLYMPLWRDDVRADYALHRLVAMAFCEHPPGKDIVRHLDGDHLNNVPSNLAWGTSSENQLDTVRHGRHPLANRTHCDSGHELTPENTIIKNGRHRYCRKCYYASNARTKARARARKSAT